MNNINQITVHGEDAGHNQRVSSHGEVSHDGNSKLGNQANNSNPPEREQTPRLETYPRRHGVSWASAEKIDGIIEPKQHVDWVMMSQFGISLEYLIDFVHNLCDQGYCPFKTVEAVIAEFGFDEMHADAVSEALFGEPFYGVIADVHSWISDYEPDQNDDWASSKRGMHDYVVWAVMENLAFLKMDEVNPNP